MNHVFLILEDDEIKCYFETESNVQSQAERDFCEYVETRR